MTTRSCNSTPGDILKRTENRCSNKYLCKPVHSSTIYNHQKVENNLVIQQVNRYTDVIYPHNGTLSSHQGNEGLITATT